MLSGRKAEPATEGNALSPRAVSSTEKAKPTYEAPALQELGSFHVETLSGCLFGKQWGGHDTFGSIVGLPISNCSA